MILTLVGAAVISTVASFLNGDYDLTDPIIILVIIIVNAIMGVIQETKAEQSLDSLKELAVPHATVIRGGKTLSLDSRYLVPGDIVLLKTGDTVPADGRILEAVQLQAEESSLTGESVPSEKSMSARLREDTPLADRKNMLFRTTAITAGHGKMIVTETGMRTEVGKIASYLQSQDTDQTPLQQKLAATSKILGLISIGICILMFFIGIWRKREILEMFLTAVSLAVAAIPEGLPAIVTIMLSLGVQRMAKNHAIIRRLPAVETLGSATVICSDKTGTLTQNRMQTARILSVQGAESPNTGFGKELLTCAVLCNDAMLTGSPTEKAFLEAGRALGLEPENLNRKYPRLEEVPFDSARKYMLTRHRMSQGPFGLTGTVWLWKGAPDVLLARCTSVWTQRRFQPINASLRRQLQRQNEQLASEGLRVLAFAVTQDSAGKPDHCAWLGSIALIDPPRPEVKGAIESCRTAGIRIIMITGDHPTTARTIGRNLGICGTDSEDCVMTGEQLDRTDDQELIRRLPGLSVFARVTPAHKLRIVQCLKACHETVAMSGDGVNDSPALKAADIGCAMGKNGTDVARNASDMILTDDNFATIVAAVKEGRTIYDNIKKSIHFLLSSNIGEILTIFTAIAIGYPSPLLPVQLLWMNLVTDSLPAIALGVEPPEEDIMERPPIPRDQGIFANGFGLRIFLEGIMIGLLALIAYLAGFRMEGTAMAQTMTFMVLSLSQLFHVFNVRSRKSLFHIGFFSNGKLTVSFLICFALQVSVAVVPVLQSLFSVASMDLTQWAIVMGLSLSPIIIMEMEKSLNEDSDDSMD